MDAGHRNKHLQLMNALLVAAHIKAPHIYLNI